MNILIIHTKRKIIFIRMISIFLKSLNAILILIHHVNFTLIYDRNWSCLFLHSNLFIADLSLNRLRFSFEFSQLGVSVLASWSSFVAWLLGYINYLLLNHVRLFIFILQLLQLLIRNFSFSLFLFQSILLLIFFFRLFLL